MKTLTSKLSRVGNCRLPGWGPGDLNHQWPGSEPPAMGDSSELLEGWRNINLYRLPSEAIDRPQQMWAKCLPVERQTRYAMPRLQSLVAFQMHGFTGRPDKLTSQLS
ncbi:hypothetical protein T265_10295 [Opisthorchis viverrini]|uniref:Uncharacterized protein n=1 Tax=Opisthorchis viverrini TaxID=6198 RepID=A0A075A1S9_OPIVI|nr:hypothetical protein T265_10295 [Opisthorchis viverrini]KER21364.1 hypothetical protein T265_10295 [Opisthorchis viverrini]